MSCESDDKVVQFDFVNTTTSPITIDLFNTNVLTNTPVDETLSTPEYGVDTTIGSAFSVRDYANNNSNGDVYCATTNGLAVIRNGAFILDSNFGGALVTPFAVEYNPVNNLIYVANTGLNNVRTIDATTFTLVGVAIPVTVQPSEITYNSTKNSMYVSNNPSPNLQEIDCFTDTVVSTVALPFNVLKSTFVVHLNQLWLGSTAPNNVVMRYDCATNTFIDSQFVAGIVNDIFYVDSPSASNEKVWLAMQTANTVQVIDADTFILELTDNIVGANPNGITYNPDLDEIYVSCRSIFEIIKYDPNTYARTQPFPLVGNLFYNVQYNTFTKLLTANSFTLQTIFAPQGVSSTTYYVGGAVDYNFFIQNLESDPIKLDCLEIITDNQDQLNNNLSVVKRDADGNSKTNPNFPILDVSAWQQQGNRAKVPLEGLILDGRTFFSNYTLNANETVVFKVCYKQLNRFCFKDNPELFTSLTPISEKEKEKLEKEIIERDKKESGEDESKFEIIKGSIALDITVTNNTGTTSTFNFFQANQNQLIVNTPSVDFADVNNYNFLVQQLRDSPLVLNAVEIVSSDQNQLTLPISVKTDDANGDSITYQHFPINKVATAQQQGNRVIVKTNHEILDGYTTFANYNILPTTTVSFVLYYEQFNRSLFLKKHFYTKIKEPIFNNGMGLDEEMEYFNEISENPINKNGIKNIVKKSEKNSNFETEQVYSSSFEGEKYINPMLSINKTQLKDNKKTDIQKTYNYRNEINNYGNIKLKNKIY